MASRKSKKRVNRGRQTTRPVPDKVRESPRNAPEKELAGLKPKPARNERVEDIAVFTNVGREQLSDALKMECIAVMDSLDSVSDGNFDQANERLKNIARNSPYADWRLFVRGLCGFYAKDFETAKQNWQRLEANRRPARIAATLVVAELKQELAEFTAPPTRLVETARMLLHRSSAIAAAKQILSVKHRDSEIRFSPSQVAMLTNFRDDFRRVDADFVAKFSQACVYLSCAQPMPDTFMLLKKSVPGPPHDPRWNLQEFLYMRQFDDIEEEREDTAKAYIENDLPSMTQFSKEQKGALASCILLDLARMLELIAAPRGRPFFFFDEPPDYKAIEKLLGTAIKSYQKNREAHSLLFDILNRQIESQRRLTKAQIEAAEKRLVKAKEAFVSAFPGEIETSLMLVDLYFSNDQLDKADALVKQLSSQRLDAPLAKALPWKLKLLGAMHNSRKKAELSSARESLAIADAQWPTWLARTWLPFLKAALELRVGNQEQFETLDRQARQDAGAGQVACDFMTFAAIQQMNVPAAVMKPFRETITKFLAEVEQMPLSDLVSIGAFFWDLSRAGLEHKAFRLQASKVGKAICTRLKKGEKIPHSNAFIDASCFCAARGFWKNGYDFRQPPWTEELSKTEPKLAAAFIGWVLKSSYSGYSLVKFKPLIESLQEAAKTEKDPFYRYRFEHVALSAKEAIAEYNRGRSSSGMMGQFFEEKGNDDESNEDCQCPKCRAKRAQEAARNSRSRPNDPSAQTQRQQLLDLDYDFFDDEDDDELDEYEVEDDEFDENGFEMDLGVDNAEFQAFMARIAARIGLDRMEKFAEALASAASKAEREPHPSIMLRNIVEVFKQFGLPYEEAVEFVRVLASQAELANGRSSRIEDQFDDLPDALPAQTQRPPATAEERKAADKKRRRELEKKKRR